MGSCFFVCFNNYHRGERGLRCDRCLTSILGLSVVRARCGARRALVRIPILPRVALPLSLPTVFLLICDKLDLAWARKMVAQHASASWLLALARSGPENDRYGRFRHGRVLMNISFIPISTDHINCQVILCQVQVK